jgi:hypothetical protein
MSRPNVDQLEVRLSRVERQGRVARACILTAAGCTILGAAAGFQGRGEPIVRASRLELVDSLGRVRASLQPGAGASAWTLLDEAGHAVAALTLEQTGQIVVRDGEGRGQAVLGPPTAHHLSERQRP